jgi:hypothetical protein
MFKDGWTNVHDEEQSGWPSVVSDDLLQSVGRKICERWRFTISELTREFPQISHTVYEIITVRLGCHKFWARWISKILVGAHKTQRMALALIFLERYCKDGIEFLGYIIWVPGYETWVLFINVETKEQSRQWMHTCSPNKPKQFKQTSTRKLMPAVFWDRKEVLMLEFMQQETTISEVYCVWNTKRPV